MLTVYLKSGEAIQIPNFEKVSYWSSGTLRELASEKFNEFSIHAAFTYNFIGESQISVVGSEILYLEFYSD